MRVISQGPGNRVYCPSCFSTLEYDEDDIKELCEHKLIICPCCQNFVELDTNADDEANKVDDRPIFPLSFYQYGVRKGSVHLSDEEIQRFVDEAFNYEHEMEPSEAIELGSGDTAVIAIKYEDCFKIIVAKNVWEHEKYYN